MKALKLIAVLLVLRGGVLPAQAHIAPFGVSAGVGVDFKSIFTVIKTDIPGCGSGTLSAAQISPFGFLDFTFAEVKLGIDFAQPKLRYLNFGLLAKLPLSLNDAVTLYPLAGFNYTLFLKGSIMTGVNARGDLASSDMSKNSQDVWSFDAGVGLDFNITERFYIRNRVIYEYRLLSKYAKDIVSETISLHPGYDYKRATHGLVVTLAAGFRLGRQSPSYYDEYYDDEDW